MWYVMLDVMSLCYDIYTTGYDGVMSLQDPPSGSLCPFTYLSASSCDNTEMTYLIKTLDLSRMRNR
jgi:hypothetical protein